MVGPVGVQHFQLSDRGVSVLFIAEIVLDEGEVFDRHGEALVVQIRLQLIRRLSDEAFHGSDRFNRLVFFGERLAQILLAGFDRVDHVDCDRFFFLFGQVPRKLNHAETFELDALRIVHQLQALHRRIRSLVVLPRQVFRHQRVIRFRQGFRPSIRHRVR